MAQSITVTIANTIIHQDHVGRYCLNDLHRAAGGEKRHAPNEWLRNKQTQDLVAEISRTGISGIQSKQQLGTFGCREVAIAYATWISPAFFLKVIRAYDEQATELSAAVRRELLACNPTWAKIARYKGMGLRQHEIARLIGAGKGTVRKHTRRMEACGLLVPPANLPALQQQAQRLIGGAS